MPALPIPRLASLIRMLGSDRDGEVLAAVAAIGRALATADSDFHGLAEALGSGNGRIPEADMQRLFDAGYKAGLEQGRARAAQNARPETFRKASALSWREIALRCSKLEPLLHEREKQFVAAMTLRSRPLTARQAEWLAAIYLRLGGKPQNIPDVG